MAAMSWKRAGKRMRPDARAMSTIPSSSGWRSESSTLRFEAIRRDEAWLAELARDYYAEHRIEAAEYHAARDAITPRLAANRKALSSGGDTGRVLEPIIGQARQRWVAMSFDQRRAIIVTVLESVRIGPGRRGYNKFELSRVSIEWRF